jgi:glyoxalase family protein
MQIHYHRGRAASSGAGWERAMSLDGIHHVTAVAADAQGTVDFYVGVMGLRLVKQTVNFDAPDMYHLYFGDETGSPGSLLTFFEIPAAPPGRPGAGMIHRVVWRAPSPASIDYWAERLADAGRPVEREGDGLVSSDPEGLGIEVVPAGEADGAPRAAWSADVPAEHALPGIVGVRAYSRAPEATEEMLVGGLGFVREAAGVLVAAAEERRGVYRLDPAPPGRGEPGAGTVHHVAWTSPDADHADWGRRVARAGGYPTGIIDRQYFRSIYFREPGGVLLELATPSPGFAVDEDPDHLGEALRLPPQYEPYRERIAERLAPLRNPRAGRAVPAGEGER